MREKYCFDSRSANSIARRSQSILLARYDLRSSRRIRLHFSAQPYHYCCQQLFLAQGSSSQFGFDPCRVKRLTKSASNFLVEQEQQEEEADAERQEGAERDRQEEAEGDCQEEAEGDCQEEEAHCQEEAGAYPWAQVEAEVEVEEQEADGQNDCPLRTVYPLL